MANKLFQFVVLTSLFAFAAHATPVYHFVYTGQSGAQTQIDQNHSSTWTFNISSGSFDLAGGKLDMKDGPQTSATVSLEVWLGAVDTGTLVQALTLSNAQFASNHTPSNKPQQFGQTLFQFPAPVTLSAPGTYIVQLVSTAPDQQAMAYFIKGGGIGTFLDENGNPPPDVTFTGGQQQGGEVPEPSTWALTGCAGLLLALRWRRTSAAR